MTNTLTTPTTSVIELTTGTLQSDVFYGNLRLDIDGKTVNVLVSNHLKEDKRYEFRVAAKCKAGFVNISDSNCTPKEIIKHYHKNSLVNIQVMNEHGHWMNVFTTKGGKWYSIDKGFLDILTVGDMRESHPNMCDSEMWSRLGAKTWADKAFTKN